MGDDGAPAKEEPGRVNIEIYHSDNQNGVEVPNRSLG